MKKRVLLAILVTVVVTLRVSAQQRVKISLDNFLERISTANLDYLAERLNLDLAEAQIMAASVFNNPSLSFAFYDNDQHRMHLGYGALIELSQTFSPGRRSAAINIANSEKELAHALLAGYLNKMREEAMEMWLEAVKHMHLLKIKRESYNDQLELMLSDSLSRGDDYNLDLDILQNKVETGILYAEIIDMERDLENFYIDITQMCGTNPVDTLFFPEKRNIMNEKCYELSYLIELALENRADIVAAKKEGDLSRFALKAAKNERIPEFDIFLGYNINAEVKNEIAPVPKFSGIEIGLNIPLPLFNRNKGEIAAATVETKRAEYKILQAQNEVKSEVVKAYNNFERSTQKLNLFKSGLVKNAKDALEQKRTEYFKGEIHLIEVLDAQRSYDEVLASFYSAIYDKSQSLVLLQSAAGIWDIE